MRSRTFARQMCVTARADRQLRVLFRLAKNRALQQFERGEVVHMWREPGKRDSTQTTKTSQRGFSQSPSQRGSCETSSSLTAETA